MHVNRTTTRAGWDRNMPDKFVAAPDKHLLLRYFHTSVTGRFTKVSFKLAMLLMEYSTVQIICLRMEFKKKKRIWQNGNAFKTSSRKTSHKITFFHFLQKNMKNCVEKKLREFLWFSLPFVKYVWSQCVKNDICKVIFSRFYHEMNCVFNLVRCCSRANLWKNFLGFPILLHPFRS